MDSFHYKQGELYCEDVSIRRIVEEVGSPAFIYSKRTLVDHFDRFASVFSAISPAILFSVKSCNNLSLLQILIERGAGMDVVSAGEMFRALRAGAKPENIVFAGVGKSAKELREGLKAKIGWFNVESEEELQLLASLAEQGNHRPQVAIRLNPDVIDPRTHQNTATGGRGSKFGIDLERVAPLFEKWKGHPHIDLSGLHFHLGSPIFSAGPYLAAIRKVLELKSALESKGCEVKTIDIGGGFVAHDEETAEKTVRWDEYAGPIAKELKTFVDEGGRVLMEPGRTISANCAILACSVLYRKQSGSTSIAVVDTGMHQLLRPALYQAEHFMWPVSVHPEHIPSSRTLQPAMDGLEIYDVVGPICESTDRLARARSLPPLERNSLFAIFSAGAYGMVMASQYNATPRPPEILVDGASFQVIRARESYEDMIAKEVEVQPHFAGD